MSVSIGGSVILNNISNDEKEHNKICGEGYKYRPAIMKSNGRVVVFGDIHGDYDLTIDLFTKSGLAKKDSNDNLIWTGEDTYVVQVGDQIDRCRPSSYLSCDKKEATKNDEDSDLKIMELFNDLAEQAQKVGGDVISLLGNHELMNVQGNMNYVSYEGRQGFKNYRTEGGELIKDGEEARIYRFQPGNDIAKMLGCSRMATVIIDDNIYVHAGIVDGLINEIGLQGVNDFDRINMKIKKWLLGLIDEEYVTDIIKYSEYSMFWTRLLGSIDPGLSLNHPKCLNSIDRVLKIFKVGAIVIGHTPQSFIKNDDINGTCSNRVIRTDNGSSKAFDSFDKNILNNKEKAYSRRTQWLECNNGIFYVCDGSSKKILN